MTSVHGKQKRTEHSRRRGGRLQSSVSLRGTTTSTLSTCVLVTAHAGMLHKTGKKRKTIVCVDLNLILNIEKLRVFTNE